MSSSIKTSVVLLLTAGGVAQRYGADRELDSANVDRLEHEPHDTLADPAGHSHANLGSNPQRPVIGQLKNRMLEDLCDTLEIPTMLAGVDEFLRLVLNDLIR